MLVMKTQNRFIGCLLYVVLLCTPLSATNDTPKEENSEIIRADFQSSTVASPTVLTELPHDILVQIATQLSLRRTDRNHSPEQADPESALASAVEAAASAQGEEKETTTSPQHIFSDFSAFLMTSRATRAACLDAGIPVSSIRTLEALIDLVKWPISFRVLDLVVSRFPDIKPGQKLVGSMIALGSLETLAVIHQNTSSHPKLTLRNVVNDMGVNLGLETTSSKESTVTAASASASADDDKSIDTSDTASFKPFATELLSTVWVQARADGKFILYDYIHYCELWEISHLIRSAFGGFSLTNRYAELIKNILELCNNSWNLECIINGFNLFDFNQALELSLLMNEIGLEKLFKSVLELSSSLLCIGGLSDKDIGEHKPPYSIILGEYFLHEKKFEAAILVFTHLSTYLNQTLELERKYRLGTAYLESEQFDKAEAIFLSVFETSGLETILPKSRDSEILCWTVLKLWRLFKMREDHDKAAVMPYRFFDPELNKMSPNNLLIPHPSDAQNGFMKSLLSEYEKADRNPDELMDLLERGIPNIKFPSPASERERPFDMSRTVLGFQLRIPPQFYTTDTST